KEGLTGNLGEISIWLSKEDNAWLNKEGKGKYGWEELPYWLKGYANIGYMLKDQKMIKESEFWINAVLNNQRDNGDFGPMNLRDGKRDLWGNMPMLWCLESYFEYTQDKRVLPFMTKYFKWQLSLNDNQFLEDYWEKSRGGDNIRSVYWLYNRTGNSFLLNLATKIDKNTADWRQKNNLPNWHNVNIAQSFREPAQYFQQSKLGSDLEATYHNFKLIRNLYGQVPGGMFGSDENARKGYDDPRQAVETCGIVEEITSNGMLLPITGDSFWADNTEDVAFNMFPSAFTPDYRALRYLTAPNMAINDSKNHSPGIDNSGPFLMMNPFSSRCCQHNHSAGWVYFEESSWMATPDNGLAVQLYNENQIDVKVANGKKVRIKQETQYPFDDQVKFIISTDKKVSFPLYLRIPEWCENPQVKINGKPIPLPAKDGAYIQLDKKWNNNDVVTLTLPMKIKVREWEKNKNSVSVNYGPLTYSLKIKEDYVKKDSKVTAIGDSGWQDTADADQWPSFEIYPGTPWNYGLLLKGKVEDSFEVVKKTWPANDNPFTNQTAPIVIKALGKRIPEWGIDQYGLVAVLPQSPVKTDTSSEELVLVPMGGARLRISAFPVVK
ncbi:MAG: glycoside hydrolase family 127 protein, partial [Oligoflexus sp.]|nr:glycoside hydrolase family 127 protein [Pseudopedobacter sp.]